MAARDRLLLGMDVGGTKVVIGLGRGDGEILAERRLEPWASGSWQQDLDRLAREGRALVEQQGLLPSDLAAVGVCAPGPLDARTGRVIEAPNLPGWHDVPVCDRLGEAIGAPCRLENDANAAALAEWRHGAGQGTHHMAFLTMSTGVGGGLILDGRLHRGARGLAGELGHIPVVADGRPCACGLRGCLEAYTGGAAIAARIREDIGRGVRTDIADRAGGSLEAVSARLWCDAIRAGDPYALGLREEFLDRLTQAMAILAPSLDLERIVLGTIVQRNPDLFLDEIRRRLRERIWPQLRDLSVVPGELGARLPAYAGLCAAALDPEDPPSSPEE